MAETKNPLFLDRALTFYGEAFDHRSKKAVTRSMTEWAELDEDEQSFAQAHLLFLNIQAQAATQKLLVQVRDLLDEVAEGLTTAIEASLVEPAQEEAEEPEGDDQVEPDLLAQDHAVSGEDEPEEYEIDGEDASEGGS